MLKFRLKFWVDTLETVYQNTPPAHPVATQLSKAVQKHKLNKRWLQRLINSREEHLSIKSFESVAALETYAENSVSSVLYLTLECLSIRNVHADHAASHIGRAQGLATLLRAIPYQAQRNKVYIPLELLVKYKVSQNELIRGSNEKKIKDLVFDLASTANAHVEKVGNYSVLKRVVKLALIYCRFYFRFQARSLMNTVPKEAKVGLMTAVSTVSYLERLRRVDFNIYDGRLMERNNLLPWLFWWNNFRNKF